jgi:2-methylisocitrate lyase-like PEP mutase family enzyme
VTSRTPSAPDRLRALLAGTGCLTLPCCFDALSARLIEQAGFPLTFMSGFAVSAARLAELGYRLAAYPLALLSVAVAAMQEALRELAAGRMPERQMDFAALRTLVGFDAYDRLLDAYAAPLDRCSLTP